MPCGGITISFKHCFALTALARPQQSVLSGLRRPSELNLVSETDILSCIAIKCLTFALALQEDRYHMLIWQLKTW